MRNVRSLRAAGGPLLAGMMAWCFTATAASAADDFTWVRGANYVPSYARNDVQIWMDYDPAVVDRELGYAAKLKLNCVRVFLQVAVYECDPQRFLDNLENLLGLCAQHRLQMMPVLFDSCFGEFPDLERYRDKDWMACPGQNRLGPGHWPAMQQYVADVVGRHRNDRRIVMWDVMNEPTCTSFYKEPEDKEAIHTFLKQALGWVKAQQPSQPRTVGVMHSQELELVQEDVEVLAFHNYRRDLRDDIRRVQALGRRLGKPVVINEVVMRPQQPFDFALPILREEKIGWVFWELMLGKTQFTRDANSIQGLIYPDGTCRDARHVAAVMDLSVERALPLFPQPHPAPPPLPGEALPVPRLLFGDATRHGRPFAKDPSVLRLGDRYLMYYSMAPSTNPASPKGWAIGIAESRDLTDWQKVGEILPEQPCEQNGLVNGKALLLAGKVHLFYNSYGNGRNDALCHASSDDGLKFTRHPDNPILHPTGAWNSGRAIDCDAFEFRDKLWLIYATRDPSMQTQMLVAATADLRSNFGREAWTPVGDGPILQPELPWETRCIEAPSVIQRGDTLYLFYGGGYNNDPQQIGCATSTDGLHWTRLFREPLIPNGQPGDWNSSETGHPGVFTETDGRTYLFVQGNQDKGHTWFLSAYEITWQHGRPAVVWDSDRFPMKRPGPAAHSEGGIAFSPGWTCWRGEGPRGGGLHYANRAGATATWETHGGNVTILHKVGPDGGLARVLIDGQPAVPPEFDSYAPTVEWHHRRVLATNLPPGRHTVTLTVLGRKNEKSSDTYVQIVEVEPGPPSQYILFNRAPGQGMYQGEPESLGRQHFEEVLTHFPNRPAARIQTGLSYVFSPLRTPPATTLAALRTFLAAAAETATPVLIQIDLEHWWEARPDLWNWWDPARAGYDPANRENVEWTGWSPEQAVKVAWRNWGQQIRVLPPPNLASPRYLAACREEIRRLVPVVLDWHAGLPADQKHLLVGIKLGHETSIGVNAFHFPNGNALLDRPPTEDPVGRLDHNDPVSRGLATLGHAALTASGIRTNGTPTEAELREVARRYLETLCREAAAFGVPRDRLFAHGAGWKEGELIYDVPVNPFACPGWSFYQHAADPRKDVGVQRNLARSDAPYWAATEWLLQGPGETDAWRRALANTLSDSRCRYVCIFNWESIRASDAILRAVSELTSSEDR